MTWTLQILLPESLRRGSATCSASVDENNEWEIHDITDERQIALIEYFKGLAEDFAADTTRGGHYLPDDRPGAIHAAGVVIALPGSRIIGSSDPLPFSDKEVY